MYGAWILFIVFICICIVSFCIFGAILYVVGDCWGAGVAISIGLLTVLAALICLLCAIFCPLSAQRQYIKFQETQAIVLEIGDDFDTENLETIGIAKKMIEMNNWLANARADKATYGNWSKYYALDLDNLKPITIRDDG